MSEADFWRQIAAGDHTARLALADWLEERGDMRASWVRDDDIVAHMLPDGRDPLPSLLEAVFDGRESGPGTACATVARLGAYAMPAVIDRLTGRGCLFASGIVSRMAPEAALPFAERLTFLAENPSGHLYRESVPEFLYPLGAAALPALGAIVKSLPERGETYNDYHPSTGERAAEILGHFGPAALPAVPGMVRLMRLAAIKEGYIDAHGEHVTVKHLVTERVLVGLGPRAVPAILGEAAALGPGLPVPGVLRVLRRAAAAEPGALRDYLDHAETGTRATAAFALAEADAEAAMPVLVAALDGWTREPADTGLLAEAVLTASAKVRPPLDILRRVMPRVQGRGWAILADVHPSLDDGPLAEARRLVVSPSLTDADAQRARAMVETHLVSANHGLYYSANRLLRRLKEREVTR